MALYIDFLGIHKKQKSDPPKFEKSRDPKKQLSVKARIDKVIRLQKQKKPTLSEMSTKSHSIFYNVIPKQYDVIEYVSGKIDQSEKKQHNDL